MRYVLKGIFSSDNVGLVLGFSGLTRFRAVFDLTEHKIHYRTFLMYG